MASLGAAVSDSRDMGAMRGSMQRGEVRRELAQFDEDAITAEEIYRETELESRNNDRRSIIDARRGHEHTIEEGCNKKQRRVQLPGSP